MLDKIKDVYENKYKLLLIIPIILLVLAIGQITMQMMSTGDFMNKDVSLKGGMTVTIPIDHEIDEVKLEDFFSNKYPENDVSIRYLSGGGETKALIVAADIDVEDTEMSNSFIADLAELSKINRKNFSIEFMGSSLGESFFQETFKAIIMAFLLMGAIVFLYFGETWVHKTIVTALTLLTVILFWNASNIVMTIIVGALMVSLLYMYIRYSIPSFAVILAALSDIIITLAIVNLLEIKLSTAGIAAFLMLIGYSVDTDILLSTKVLKRKEGTVMERIYSAMKTGFTMNITTITALTVGIILSESPVISQIMIILLIGLLVDMINTWIQNVGILRLYLEKRR